MIGNKQVWIGLTDYLVEGEWRKPGYSASDVVFNTRMDGNLFSWGPGEPNNGLYPGKPNHNCVITGFMGQLFMDDQECWLDRFGLCEIKLPEH